MKGAQSNATARLRFGRLARTSSRRARENHPLRAADLPVQLGGALMLHVDCVQPEIRLRVGLAAPFRSRQATPPRRSQPARVARLARVSGFPVVNGGDRDSETREFG